MLAELLDCVSAVATVVLLGDLWVDGKAVPLVGKKVDVKDVLLVDLLVGRTVST
jgi:hypothetical protein